MMRDDERYPIPADPPVTWENGESGSSLPQVSATQNYDGHRDKYLSPAHGSIELRSTVSETSALAPIATEKSARPKRTILGLRRRVFWSIAGVVTILVIVDAVVGAVIGSSKIGSTSSSTTTTAPMTAQQRGIGAATMNITGSTATNVQVVYQDLDSTDLLYRLVWNDKAGAEQRISSLDPSPQQKTPIAVTTANNTANDGIVTSIFYLSENHDNSSLSDIGQVTLQCSLGVENCTVSVIGKISDGALKGVLHNSGLAAVLLPDSSDIRVYYKNGGHAIRALVGNGTTTDGWDDILIGSQASPQSSISVNFDQKNGNLQVVFVNMSSKLLQEIVYSDAAGVGTTSAISVTSSAPSGWKPAAKFSTCFQPGLNQHHIFYVDSTGDIYGLFRGDSQSNWTFTKPPIGTAVGGIGSVAWDSQVRLMYMAGDPLTLSMSVNNNSDWSDVRAL